MSCKVGAFATLYDDHLASSGAMHIGESARSNTFRLNILCVLGYDEDVIIPLAVEHPAYL